jgi:hypothetical protein
MAKKKTQQRRVPHATDPRMYGDGKPSQAAGASQATTGTSPANGQVRAPAQPQRVPVTVTTNYDYVRRDLRHLAIVAASIFAVLIAMGLIIK